MQEMPPAMEAINQASPPLTPEELEQLRNLPRRSTPDLETLSGVVTQNALTHVYLKMRDPKAGLHPDNLVVVVGDKILPFVKSVSVDMNAQEKFALVNLSFYANVHVEET